MLHVDARAGPPRRGRRHLVDDRPPGLSASACDRRHAVDHRTRGRRGRASSTAAGRCWRRKATGRPDTTATTRVARPRAPSSTSPTPGSGRAVVGDRRRSAPACRRSRRRPPTSTGRARRAASRVHRSRRGQLTAAAAVVLLVSAGAAVATVGGVTLAEVGADHHDHAGPGDRTGRRGGQGGRDDGVGRADGGADRGRLRLEAGREVDRAWWPRRPAHRRWRRRGW